MNDLILENLLEQIITEYKKRMKSKIFCHILEEDDFSRNCVEHFRKEGFEIVSMKDSKGTADRTLSTFGELMLLTEENLQGIFVYGLGAEEALSLIEGRAKGDTLLFLLWAQGRMPVWLGLPDLARPFKKEKTERGRQLLLGCLKRRGFTPVIQGTLPEMSENSPAISSEKEENPVEIPQGGEEEMVIEKRFVTLSDLPHPLGKVLYLTKNGRCTMAARDYLVSQGVEIRRL